MKKIKQCCVNCHYACLQFKNLVLLPDGSPKYNFSKDWDFSIEDPLMCFYRNLGGQKNEPNMQ